MFEYQTLITQLTGMEVANSSLYDGSSSLAEAALMAARVTKKDQILIPASLHPRYEKVVRTYSANHLRVDAIPLSTRGDNRSTSARSGTQRSIGSCGRAIPKFLRRHRRHPGDRRFSPQKKGPW